MKRDVLELRHRIAVAIACFPLSLAPMLTACAFHVDDAEAVEDEDPDARDQDLDADFEPRRDLDQDLDLVDSTGEEFRETGYNHCREGEWIIPQATVWQLAETGVDRILDCPARIPNEPPTWSDGHGSYDFSVYFDAAATQRLRDAGDTRCAYSWTDMCAVDGRLLADEDASQLVAPLVPGAAWVGLSDASADAAAAPLDPALRARLAQGWLGMAQAEHASIASFARATLELMRHGAPPALLAAAQRAAADEVDHAQRCLEQARRLGHAPQTFGPLDAPPAKNGTLAELAVDTLVEGCLGETIAITIATRGLERCEDPQARATLGRILDDETRHAALAWTTVSWALSAGGEPVRQALMTAAADIEAAVGRVEAPDADAAEDPLHATLAAHGRVEGPARLTASLDAWRGIIRPNLVALGLLTSPGLG